MYHWFLRAVAFSLIDDYLKIGYKLLVYIRFVMSDLMVFGCILWNWYNNIVGAVLPV